jgi:hypothetical protein
MLLAVLSSIALGAVWKLGLQEQRQGATA